MIFFVPGYDPATESNLAVAERILPEDCRPLLKEHASRENLVAALAREEIPLFAMAHGVREALLGHGHERAFSEKDIIVLGRRSVFAYACHTAGTLGREAARGGAIWWGYTGAIQCPDSSAAFLPVFVGVFSRIRDAFSRARSFEDCRAVLLLIGNFYDETVSEVGDLMLDNPDLDTTEANYCLTHLWQRLRVWWPGEELPLKHPAAPDPILFL